MAIGREERKISGKTLAGAALMAAAAIGVMAATPRGREVIKKTINPDEEFTDETGSADLASWLKDAYAMEEGQIVTLQGVMADFEDYEEIYETINQHLQITMKQKDDVKKALASIGEKPAKTKEILGSLVGKVPAIDLKMSEDKKVKSILTLMAAEQFEVASYEALLIAAETEGRRAIANTMSRIAKEEKDMARWLEKMLPKIVKDEVGTV